MARIEPKRRTTLTLVAVLALGAVAASQLGVGAAAKQDGRAGSGGRAVAHRAGGRVASAPAGPDARIYRVADAAIEPTLGITKKGDVFYAAAAGVTGVDVMRSTDDGGTWEET
ncbi:MAG TPA: hypothetical protein VHN37_02925 [Actinomycetota bacterium]|nr:hypothetical protein [Actinomycetota bacterium]